MALNLIASFHSHHPDIKKIMYVWPDVTESMRSILGKNGVNEIRIFPCNESTETPWVDFWEPQHFAWKLWTLRHALTHASKEDLLLYLDAGTIVAKPIHSIWNTIQEKDIFILDDNEQKNERWCHPLFCNKLLVQGNELKNNQIWAGCLGFKKDSKFDSITSMALEIAKTQRDVIVGAKWQPYSQTCMGHRHDQSILSILTLRAGCPRVPLHSFYCDHSLRAAKQLHTPLYVHRGNFREMVPFVDKIDEAYIINLSRRADRYTKFQLANANIKDRVYRWNAIDGSTIQLTPDIVHLFRNNDFSWKKSVMGCALSHYGLWQKLANDTLAKSYLILEDDVQFEERWLIKWIQANASMPSDADVIYLGGVLPPNKPAFPTIVDPVNAFFAKVKQNNVFGGNPRRYFHFCNYSYILTQSGARKLCALVKEKGIFTSGDHMIVNHGDRLLNIYFTTPLLTKCYQEEDPVYQKSEFNNFNRVDSFDSDLWNNDVRFTQEEVNACIQEDIRTVHIKESTPIINNTIHAQRVSIWNDFLRNIAVKNVDGVLKGISEIFQIWNVMTSEEYEKHMGWFRIFEQLIMSNNSELISLSSEIQTSIHKYDLLTKMTPQLWQKILDILGMKETKKLVLFHIHDVDPAYCLESEWLNTVFPYSIEWKKLTTLTELTKHTNPIVVYQNIPGKADMVSKLFRHIVTLVEENNSSVTLLHMSDEFGIDDISIYANKAVKHVIRNYWRPDLGTYGEKVFILPLGFAKGRKCSKKYKDTPKYCDRHSLWGFAGSLDREGRKKALSLLHTIGPYEDHSKPDWSSPPLLEGDAYMNMLQNTKFIPCFRGSKALESFRFYEALEAGAIPIYVPGESLSSKDELAELFGKHPFLGFPSWEKAIEILPKLATQNELMEKQRAILNVWWTTKQAEIKKRLAEICLN